MKQDYLKGVIYQHELATTIIITDTNEKVRLPHEYLDRCMQNALLKVDIDEPITVRGHLITSETELPILHIKTLYVDKTVTKNEYKGASQ